MTRRELEVAYLLHDGQVAENLALASKAMEAGKFEKAAAYALIAQVHQAERDEAVRVEKNNGYWS